MEAQPIIAAGFFLFRDTLNGMIDGRILILDAGGVLHVVFTSLEGTGEHQVSSRSTAEHFIAGTLGCSLGLSAMDGLTERGRSRGIAAQISAENYKTYFSK
jgi:hypothetical protein